MNPIWAVIRHGSVGRTLHQYVSIQRASLLSSYRVLVVFTNGSVETLYSGIKLFHSVLIPRPLYCIQFRRSLNKGGVGRTLHQYIPIQCASLIFHPSQLFNLGRTSR